MGPGLKKPLPSFVRIAMLRAMSIETHIPVAARTAPRPLGGLLLLSRL